MKTKEEIVESNKLIAKFMGVRPEKTKFTENWYDGQELKDAGLPFSPGIHGNGTDTLKFYSSWDWLMPVVEKIENLDQDKRVTHMYSVEISGNGTSIQPSIWGGDRWLIRHNSNNNRLPNTYRSIVEFIVWYNKKQYKQ